MNCLIPENLGQNAEVENTCTEYKVITVNQQYCNAYLASKELEKQVNQHIKEGWSLQGGVSVGIIHNSNTFCMCQAMVKYPERKFEKKNDFPEREIVTI